MKRLLGLALLLAAAPAPAQVTALVGGTLIDGTLRAPIARQRGPDRGRAHQGGRPRGRAGRARRARRDLDRGHERAARPVGHARAPHDQRARRLRALGQDLPGAASASVIMPASAKQLLHAGVTGARDLGAPLEDTIAVREAIADGTIEGPTLFVSGPFIQKKPYPGTEAFRWGVDGAGRRAGEGEAPGRRRRRRDQADRPGPDDDRRGRGGRRRGARAQAAGGRARAPAGRDPPRARGRRRLLRAHRACPRRPSIRRT